jgi:hypothetical protein
MDWIYFINKNLLFINFFVISIVQKVRLQEYENRGIMHENIIVIDFSIWNGEIF